MACILRADPSSSERRSMATSELERVLSLPAALAQLNPDMAKLKGCPAKEIAKLERAHGLPLPDWYRAYLESMGRSVGIVRYYQEADLQPKTVLKMLERVKWRSPRYLLIGLAAADSEFDVYVDRGEDGRGTTIVSFEYPLALEPPEPVLPLATGFSTYIFLALAVRVRNEMPANGVLSAGTRSPGLFPALRRQLGAYGAREHPLSGDWDKVFIGPRLIASGRELANEQSLSV